MIGKAALLAGVLGFALGRGAAAAEGPEEFAALFESAGVEVTGIGHLNEAKPGELAPIGSLEQALDHLLEHYNVIVVRDAEERPTRVTILGRRSTVARVAATPAPPPAETAAEPQRIETQRFGNHHRVETVLIGPNKRPITLNLLVDTGASSVVLPQSLVAKLGLRKEALTPGTTQTANGRTPILRGTIDEVRLAGHSLQQVTVDFIEDERLGNQPILGMSVLGNFKVSLDSQNNILVLDPR